MNKNLLSVMQFETALDKAPAAIYICAADNMELLYANQSAKDLFLKQWNTGAKTCYEAAGYHKPCPFCPILLSASENVENKVFCHPDTGRSYPFFSYQIDTDKRTAYVQYIQILPDINWNSTISKELVSANEKMQDIINAIQGGVAIYKVSDIFETVYFSDGVPQLTGYTTEEYKELIKKDAAEMTYREDTQMVVAKAMEAVLTHEAVTIEFRKQHRSGSIVWVRAQIKWIGEEDGCPLLHCVFHDITDFKETQSEMNHLVNSIPGGIASYRVENNRFIPTYFSDGVLELSGHTRQEFEEIIRDDALNVIYEPDRARVLAEAAEALESGKVLDVSYRMRHQNGKLIWVHLNGRRMGPRAEMMKFYAVFTGMSAETRLFQSIANETADGIYVIDKENYDLLYINESKNLFKGKEACVGEKCYRTLQSRETPCEFCTLKSHLPDGQPYEMMSDNRFYRIRFKETDWNGIPAYIKFIQDITDEVRTREEKERLEQYFRTVLKYLPGGVAVVYYDTDGHMKPEFLSDGFAAIAGMTLDEAWALNRSDVMASVYPEDRDYVKAKITSYVQSGRPQCEILYRLLKRGGGFIWVKNSLSLIQSEGGAGRIYSVYQDVTKELEEQERIRNQYKDLLIKHYHTQDPDALLVGHCNITKNRILEISDYTNSGLLDTFGFVRENFFKGIGTFIVDETERQNFYKRYLNEPALKAYLRGDTEQRMECFVKFPNDRTGRYVQIMMNLVATPDSGDITGILTITDITQQTISDKILHRLSVVGYDFIIDLDILKDKFRVLSSNENASCKPPEEGSHSERAGRMLKERIIPRDKERFETCLSPEYMLKRLSNGPYTFTYSIFDEGGDIRTKSMQVTGIDLRLGRICLSRTDITDSVREQQGLLRLIAYTFELAGFIDLRSGSLTLYTRKTVLKNMPPYYIEHYNKAILKFVDKYSMPEERLEARLRFKTETMVENLREKPDGYDFLFNYCDKGAERFKQINVMWGDVNHRTICLVRADVTDMLFAERQTKKALQNALDLAEEANRAKSDFLSTMSHDIRTPMNAIMGMTTLAIAHREEPDRVADCLNKISASSKHLMSLINDILDMNKIERAQITLNRMHIYLPEMLGQLNAIMAPQARAAGLNFSIDTGQIKHPCFFGDALRINQILINILGNAIKYTPEGGSVLFKIEEVSSVKHKDYNRYRFTISDTGIGMSEEYMKHIFEPFSRSANTARIEGTGLGLSITKGLVDLMEGEISVESRPHKGSTFVVEIECESAGEEDGSGKAAVKADKEKGFLDEKQFEGRLFLVAEDNEINAEILSELLAMYGAKTVVRKDGVQAVKTFMDSPAGTYDAILMDIQMPVMNGYEATRLVRSLKREDAATIPIIAMTANAFSEDVEASIEAGMNAHVAKPIDLAILKDTLEKTLHK